MSDCHRDQLDIFVEAPRGASLKLKEWIEYKPTNQFNDTFTINLTITAQWSAYVDLKSCVLNVKLWLTNGDGTFEQGGGRRTGECALKQHLKAYIDTIL